MAKKTLLTIVQDCLETMDSDNVSSIHDTEEAMQVANYAKQTYEFIVSQYDWPHTRVLTSLGALSDADYPTYLRLLDNVSEVEWFKYNGKSLSYLSPEEFISLSDSRREQFLSQSVEDPIVEEVVSLDGNVKLYIKNNKDPEFWTSFDNEHIVCDGYDQEVETTLQESKSSAYLVTERTFKLEDTFVPDLPSNLVSYFQAEVNRTAHLYLRQSGSVVDERRSLAARSKLKKKSDRFNKRRVKGYGRKR